MATAPPSLRRITLLLAASTGLSRVLGYGRDMLLNVAFGASGDTDIYRASFAVPDMLNHLVAGGALSASFLPQMARLYARLDAEVGSEVRQHADVDEAFARVSSALMTVAFVLVIAAALFAEPLIARWADGFDASRVEETARLTRIVLPAQLAFLYGGLVQATLLARQRFAALALTPLLYNVGILVGGGIGAWTGYVEGFSWGALVGATLGALVVPLHSARHSLRPRLQLPGFGPEVRAFFWTALPLMAGVSLTTVDEWLAVRFGSRVGDGAISWLHSARRLVLVPIALVGSAAAQATGAFVSRLYAEGKLDELRSTLGAALAGVLALSLLLSGFAFAAAEPIVGVLFQHGRFLRSDTLHTADALRPMALGIAAWSLQTVLARGLYAVGDTWRPMIATTVLTVASLPLYDLLGDRFGIAGLALAGVLGMAAQAVALLGLSRRAFGLPLAPLAMALARALPVALIAGAVAELAAGEAVAVALHEAWPGLGAAPTLGYAVRLAIALTLWAAVAAPLALALGLPGVAAVRAKVVARLRAARPRI